MENLGAMAYSRYTGFREITDRDVLELDCIYINIPNITSLFKKQTIWNTNRSWQPAVSSKSSLVTAS